MLARKYLEEDGLDLTGSGNALVAHWSCSTCHWGVCVCMTGGVACVREPFAGLLAVRPEFYKVEVEGETRSAVLAHVLATQV